MSHIEIRREIDEWQIEVCDNCEHDKGSHYDQPKDIMNFDGSYMYTAEGCTQIMKGGRKLRGNNPYPHCLCMKFV